MNPALFLRAAVQLRSIAIRASAALALALPTVLSLLATTAAATAAASGSATAAPTAASTAAAAERNGFALEGASVDASLIRAGGPKRDGIKAVDTPAFVPASETRVVMGNTPVIGIEIDGDARAYPVHLLEYHQLVNDTVGGVPVVVSYDPLSGTPIAYRAKVGGEHLHFGVSGLVYESNFLFFDRESESLWSQMLGQAIAGPHKGTRLERIVTRQESFTIWTRRHPESKVLERPFPKKIDYRYSPFSDYWASETVPFPVSSKDERYHPKEAVLGVEVDGRARAYLGSVLTEVGGRIVDELAGRKVRVAYDLDAGAFSWEAPADVQVTDAYWFAWKAFHPQTEVWSASKPSGDGVVEPADRSAPDGEERAPAP